MSTQDKKFERIGQAIGQLVDKKNEAYGSSFEKCGEFLKLLYPAGVKPEQYDDMLILIRVFDKQMRIATDQDAFGESPYSDIAGYGILGQSLKNKSSNSSEKWVDAKQILSDVDELKHEDRPRRTLDQLVVAEQLDRLTKAKWGSDASFTIWTMTPFFNSNPLALYITGNQARLERRIEGRLSPVYTGHIKDAVDVALKIAQEAYGGNICTKG